MQVIIFIMSLFLQVSCMSEQKAKPTEKDQVESEQTLTEQIKKRKASSKAPDEVRKEFNRAINELRATGIEQKSIQKGVKAPEFQLDEANFSSMYRDSTVILKFYRGSWCPYCMMELKEYQKYLPQFEKMGAKLIFLSPDTKKEIAKTKDRHNITFPIYSDQNNQVAKKFGIAFKLDEKVGELYKKFGIDLEASQGNTNNELPMPGTYIINKSGSIIYAFSDADYTKRIDPQELFKYLR